eukprot:evm.model.scf_971.3 EVM.evm.TU.scf_971.3   scf_971:39667-42151(+)
MPAAGPCPLAAVRLPTRRWMIARRTPALRSEVARRVDRRAGGVVMAQAGGGEAEGRGRGGGDERRGGRGGDGRGNRRGKRQAREAPEEKLEERVVQVSRVSKTVKGGRNISFRAVAVVGNENGRVGVGNKSAKEIAVAVQKAVQEARKNMIDVPLSPKTRTFPHRVELSFGAARVMLRPASEGTGVIAGGAVKVVLELAGVQNCFGKQLGSNNPMNNAKATVEALRSMKTFKQVAEERDVSVPYLLGYSTGASLFCSCNARPPHPPTPPQPNPTPNPITHPPAKKRKKKNYTHCYPPTPPPPPPSTVIFICLLIHLFTEALPKAAVGDKTSEL